MKNRYSGSLKQLLRLVGLFIILGIQGGAASAHGKGQGKSRVWKSAAEGKYFIPVFQKPAGGHNIAVTPNGPVTSPVPTGFILPTAAAGSQTQ